MKVIRNGHVVEVATSNVVPGDIVTVDAGDVVGADMRLIEAINLKIDEAMLTGESEPVEKSCVTSVWNFLFLSTHLVVLQ